MNRQLPECAIDKGPRNSGYIFTVPAGTEGDKVFRDLQREAREFNKAHRLMSKIDPSHVRMTKKFVRQARLGKNNPNAEYYRNGGRSYHGNAYQRIDWKDAHHFDIYENT